MNDLDYDQEEILTQCLAEMDAGASANDCLARHTEHADWLRPLLELRLGLATLQVPEPHPAAYAVGREALLGRLTPTLSPRQPGKLLAAPWLRSRVMRVAAAGLLVFALAGGALGASAAVGVGQARDALSALHIVESAPQSGPPPQQGPVTNNASGKSSSTEPARPSRGDGRSNGANTDHGSATPIGTVPVVNPSGECVMLPSDSDVVRHPEKHTDWHAQGEQCRTPTLTPATSDDSTHTPSQAPAATPTKSSESGGDGSGSHSYNGALATRTPSEGDRAE